MEQEEIGINAGNWVVSSQDREYWRALGNAALNLRVSYLVAQILIWSTKSPYSFRDVEF